MFDLGNISKLGFGLMRLPHNEGFIDLQALQNMVDLYIQSGGNYFDTAWAYEGSEDAIRIALVERYPRESYYLATKCAAWLNCNNSHDAIQQFYTSLNRTGAQYFDFYLLHNLGGVRTQLYDEYKLWDFVIQKKSEGLIRHIGFSFHSTPEELDQILTMHTEVDFVQLQINYADWDNPIVQSRKNYEIAKKHHKPIIIMEPVKGGLLATPPACVRSILDNEVKNLSYSSWAIRFSESLSGILTVLSGMSNLEQLKDNIHSTSVLGKLSSSELSILSKAQEAIKSVSIINCSACNYCAKICPQNIGISGTIAAINNFYLYDNLEAAISQEKWLVNKNGKTTADNCIKCGLCEEICPQKLKIRTILDQSMTILHPL